MEKFTGISTHHISKEFIMGDSIIQVLSDISVHIKPGKLTMLVGPSGSGKTTFLSIITGILTPTTGTVVINDVILNNLTDQEKVLFRRHKIGFIFQQYNLLPTLTVAENVAIPLIANGMPLSEATEKAKKVLAELDMTKNVNKRPSQLSGGEQERVAIARALIHQPEFIICDEPTAALDAHTGHTVMQILRNQALQPDRVVVVVTHDSRIFSFADRIIYLSDGKLEKDEEQQGSMA